MVSIQLPDSKCRNFRYCIRNLEKNLKLASFCFSPSYVAQSQRAEMLATQNRDGGQFNTENVLALYTQHVHTHDTHLHDAKKIFDFLFV